MFYSNIITKKCDNVWLKRYWQLNLAVLKLIGGQRGDGVVRAVCLCDCASHRPVCVILVRCILKTQRRGLPSALSLHSLSPSPSPFFPYPLLPFPSPSLLMICSACRCLADWCPLTAPLMRKGCTPSSPFTHAHTHSHTHTVMNLCTTQRCIFTMHVWHTCTTHASLSVSTHGEIDGSALTNHTHLFTRMSTDIYCM